MPTPEQLAEEERQNQALLQAYQPEAPPNTSPIQFRPGGWADQASDQARQELAFQPPPDPARARPAPVQQAQPTDPGPQYPEQSMGGKVLNALSPVGGLIKSFGAMKVANGLRGSGGGASSAVDRLAESGSRDIAQAAQTSSQEETQRRNQARQNWQDKQTAQDRNSARARQGREDVFSAEARDPNSTKSQNLRSEIRTAFPKFAEDMGVNFDSMSLEDFAKAPHPGLDKSKFDSMTERQRELWSTRGQQTRDTTMLKGTQAQDLEDQKQAGRVALKHIRPLKAGGGGGAGGSGGAGSEPNPEYEQALIKEFGGADKVPPTLLAQLHAAQKTGNNDKVRMVMQAAHGQNVGGQKQADTEAHTYQKAADPYERVLAATKDARKELLAAGIDVDDYQKQDIPGTGRVNSYMPDAFQSAQGQRIRGVIAGNLANLVLEMSGKASNNEERAQLAKVAGALKGGAPENVIWGIRQIEGRAKAGLARQKASHSRGAAISAGVRVKTPDGKVHSFSGTADEAKQAGYQVVE